MEWKIVFVINISAGIIPSKRKFDDLSYQNEEEVKEEERRLLFVAMSRPTTKLYLSYSKIPSPFIEELLDVGYEWIKQETWKKDEYSDLDTIYTEPVY